LILPDEDVKKKEEKKELKSYLFDETNDA